MKYFNNQKSRKYDKLTISSTSSNIINEYLCSNKYFAIDRINKHPTYPFNQKHSEYNTPTSELNKSIPIVPKRSIIINIPTIKTFEDINDIPETITPHVSLASPKSNDSSNENKNDELDYIPLPSQLKRPKSAYPALDKNIKNQYKIHI